MACVEFAIWIERGVVLWEDGEWSGEWGGVGRRRHVSVAICEFRLSSWLRISLHYIDYRINLCSFAVKGRGDRY